MCIRMGRGSWDDSGVAGSPVVSGGLAGEGLIFFCFFRCVVLGLFYGLFCCLAGFCGLFWFCFATV